MGKLYVDLDDYKKYIKEKLEKKLTSTSGLHLGIYKTLLLNETLITLSFKLLYLALSNEILMPRWLTHQLFLQKTRSHKSIASVISQ